MHRYIRYISMYWADQYRIQVSVISIFDLYFDMQIWENMSGIRYRDLLIGGLIP